MTDEERLRAITELANHLSEDLRTSSYGRELTVAVQRMQANIEKQDDWIAWHPSGVTLVATGRLDRNGNMIYVKPDPTLPATWNNKND